MFPYFNYIPKKEIVKGENAKKTINFFLRGKQGFASAPGMSLRLPVENSISWEAEGSLQMERKSIRSSARGKSWKSQPPCPAFGFRIFLMKYRHVSQFVRAICPQSQPCTESRRIKNTLVFHIVENRKNIYCAKY